MIRKSKEDLEWLEFDILQNFPHVKHGVFLRHGGYSEEKYASLNFGGGTGDSKEKIVANRKKVQGALGVAELVSCYQSHGDVVKEIKELASDEKCDGMI